MTTTALTPDQEALTAFADHCLTHEPCRNNPAQPDGGVPECPQARELHRTWWLLWTEAGRP